MVKVIQQHNVDCRSVRELQPGQLGRVKSNGGTNHADCFVLGTQMGLRGNADQGVAPVFAINLHTGAAMFNEGTLVRLYPLDTELELRRSPEREQDLLAKLRATSTRQRDT